MRRSYLTNTCFTREVFEFLSESDLYFQMTSRLTVEVVIRSSNFSHKQGFQTSNKLSSIWQELLRHHRHSQQLWAVGSNPRTNTCLPLIRYLARRAPSHRSMKKSSTWSAVSLMATMSVSSHMARPAAARPIRWDLTLSIARMKVRWELYQEQFIKSCHLSTWTSSRLKCNFRKST